MKKIVVIAEVCVAILLLVMTCVRGGHKGVWDNGAFYRANSTEEERVYTNSRRKMTVAVGRETLTVRTGETEVARLSFEKNAAGSVTITKDGEKLLWAGYIGNWVWTVEKGEALKGMDLREALKILPGEISYRGLTSMAAGNEESRLSGEFKAFLLGTAWLLLGFVLTFFSAAVTAAATAVDKVIMSIFYDGAQDLRATKTTKILLLLLGLLLFGIGVGFYMRMLFS